MTARESIAAYVARLLATAPPLTPEQRSRIAALLAATPPRFDKRQAMAA